MSYRYKALYDYKDREHQLINSVQEIADFAEDFKRHTKEGSVVTYVGFTLVDYDQETPPY